MLNHIFERCVKCKRMWDDDVFPDSDNKEWACLTGNDTFSYGMKRFKFVEDHDPDYGYLCNECLKTMKYIELNDVKCQRCQKSYPPIFGTNDGIECNTVVNEESLKSGFGSSHDGNEIKFLNGKPNDLELGCNICDFCVADLVANGVCERIDYIIRL